MNGRLTVKGWERKWMRTVGKLGVEDTPEIPGLGDGSRRTLI